MSDNHNDSTVRFKSATVEFGGGLTIDGYQTPSGEYRVSMTGASKVLGYANNWLHQVVIRKGQTLKTLRDMNFDGSLLQGTLSRKRGGSTVHTISLDDFYVLATFAASQGSQKAQEILGSQSESLKTLFKASKPKQKDRGLESKIQQRLFKQLENDGCNPELEVPTIAGRIDILTSTELIEVKEWRVWKSAIGQVLCYSKYYPNHKKRIHFFSKSVHSLDEIFVKMVKEHCSDLDITVTWD